MKTLDNLTVRVSWMLVLVVFSVLVLAVGSLGLYANHYGRQAFGTLNQVNVEQTTALNQAYIDMLRARVQMDHAAELIQVPSFDAPGPVIETARTLMSSANSAFERFLAVPAQASQVDAIETVSQHFQSLLNTGLSLQLMVLEDADAAGYRSGQSRLSDMSQAFMASADTFFGASQEQGIDLARAFDGISAWLARAIVAALIISLLMVGLVLWRVTVNVIRPLQRIVGHFEDMANGDLSGSIEQRGRNEIGKLFSGLASMQRSLVATVATVRTSSRTIHDDAYEITQGNADLSTRTEQQAASLEETAASMDQLTSTVAQNADNAQQASQLAVSASHTAQQGGDIVTRVIDTMRDIDGSSRRVAEIIGVIDTIAFQTNILALNASVEAARAGEQGRGFSVVASEVRSLAGRSAQAASQIRDLIDDASQRIATGTKLVDQAGNTMTGIVSEVQRVTALMEDIASASGEQSRGIVQVNQTITQMEQMTQQNARLVQEATLSSQALEEAAWVLRDGVARFDLGEDRQPHGRPADASVTPPEPDADPALDRPAWQPKALTDERVVYA